MSGRKATADDFPRREPDPDADEILGTALLTVGLVRTLDAVDRHIPSCGDLSPRACEVTRQRLADIEASLTRAEAGPARIVIQPDAPAVLAARLVRRLQREGLMQPDTGSAKRTIERVTEALADEIHLAAVDGTLGGGA